MWSIAALPFRDDLSSIQLRELKDQCNKPPLAKQRIRLTGGGFVDIRSCWVGDHEIAGFVSSGVFVGLGRLQTRVVQPAGRI